MKSSILRKYLNESDYSQNLISRQEEIDSALINYVQVKFEKEREKNKLINNPAIRISKLNNLRMRINLGPKFTSNPIPASAPSHIFRDILQKSKQMISDWGGKMYFVYFPPVERDLSGFHQTFHQKNIKVKESLN